MAANKKRKKKGEAGHTGANGRRETVGWVFWTVTFAVLLVPLVWGAYQIVLEDTPFLVPAAIAAGVAAVLASFLTMGTNSALQYRAKRQRLAEKRAKR